MKAYLKLGLVQIEVEGDTQKELFAELAAATEVFGESKCGICGCEDIQYRARTVDDNEFFEYVCMGNGCGAVLSMGQAKKGGGLFPKRKIIKEGPNAGKPDSELGTYDTKFRGWTKWRGIAKNDSSK